MIAIENDMYLPTGKERRQQSVCAARSSSSRLFIKRSGKRRVDQPFERSTAPHVSLALCCLFILYELFCLYYRINVEQIC